MRYPEKSYYDTLGIPRNATAQQIKAAYREQIKFFHPDVFRGNPEVAKEKSLELNEAYAVLGDPGKRERYDFWLQERDYQRKQTEEAKARQAREDAQQSASKEETEQEPEPEPEPGESSPGPDSGGEPQQEGPEEPPHDAAVDSAPKRKEASGRRWLQIAVVGLVALLAVNVYTGQKKTAELQEQLDITRELLAEAIEDDVEIYVSFAYYKQASETLNEIYDTFDNIMSSIGIYTTIDEDGALRAAVTDSLLSNLQKTEERYAECEEIGMIDSDDEGLMEQVRDLSEAALDCISLLGEEDWESHVQTVYEDARGFSFDAMIAKMQADSYFWRYYS